MCIPFIIFLNIHIALAKTLSSTWSKNGEAGALSRLVPDFGGNALAHSPFSMMGTVGLFYITFIMFKYVVTLPVSTEFLSWKNIRLSTSPFQYLLLLMSFLSLSLFAGYIN